MHQILLAFHCFSSDLSMPCLATGMSHIPLGFHCFGFDLFMNLKQNKAQSACAESTHKGVN